MSVIGIAIIIDILLAWAAGSVAQSRSGQFWPLFIVGLVFWPLALILALAQPKRQPTPTYAPGWYPDPHGQAQQRWFDGQVWTQHVHTG